MNRTLYLTTASTILNGKKSQAGTPIRPTILREIAGRTASFECGLAKLEAGERRQLLASLMQMLERERRRCKSRAGRYDAGRHISLYLAVKSLMEMNK